tara:strand:- start:194 stop:385 length:192 start_codon:yes stop_codon:yes gene_type:complete
MFEKTEILIIAFFIFVVFYLVIFLGASKRKKKEESGEIKSYLFNVRILIVIIAIVFLILWFFL